MSKRTSPLPPAPRPALAAVRQAALDITVQRWMNDEITICRGHRPGWRDSLRDLLMAYRAGSRALGCRWYEAARKGA